MRAPTEAVQRRLVDELDTTGHTLEPIHPYWPATRRPPRQAATMDPSPYRHLQSQTREQPLPSSAEGPYHTRYNYLNEFLTRRVLQGARAGGLTSQESVPSTADSPSLPGSWPISTLRRSRTIRERGAKLVDETGSAQPLKLEMIDCDGGSLDFDSGRYMAENLLRNDTSVYCTAKLENVNILLKSAKPFVLNEMVIKAPQRSFTSPVKDGLVWVSMERPNWAETKAFDRPELLPAEDVEEETPVKQLLAGGDLPATTTFDARQALMPNAYFLVDFETGVATIRFEPPLSGRFVHVKLLSGQPFDSYPGRLERDNIDIQAILLFGQTGPHMKATFAFR